MCCMGRKVTNHAPEQKYEKQLFFAIGYNKPIILHRPQCLHFALAWIRRKYLALQMYENLKNVHYTHENGFKSY